MKRLLAGCLVVVCALSLTHCSDPTEGKTDAIVGDAIVIDDAPLGADPVATESDDTVASTEADPFSQPREGSRAKGEMKGAVYDMEANSGIQFEGSKVTGTHVGGFAKYEGMVFVPEDGTLEDATIDVLVDMTSVFSDAGGLTEKLRSDNFFDVEVFPTARFTSTGIKKDGAKYSVTGNFNLHGVTKSIVFPAEISMTDETLTAYAEFVIKQFDWGIKFRGLGKDLIRDDVLVLLDISAKVAAEEE